MPTPQTGIFAEGSKFQHFLEYAVPGGLDVASMVAAAKDGKAHCVFSFGPDLSRRLFGGDTPTALRKLDPIEGTAPKPMPATHRDLFVWIHGANRSDVLDTAMAVQRAAAAQATLVLEVQGFIYRDSRDLIGFVDGTANPKEDARFAAALVPDGQPGAGGSFVMSQKWVHDLPAFQAMPVREQEQVVGRTKVDDVELEGDDMPDNSHVSRTDAKVDGVAQKIWRRSAPFGGVAEHGLYFLAFACDIGRFDIQLQRMFGATDDGIYDRLVEFSTPVTGSYWFAPSQETLDAVK